MAALTEDDFVGDLRKKMKAPFAVYPAEPPHVPRYVDALSKLRVHYDFVAGRFELNEKDDQLEIDCNGAGVFFGVGRSDIALEELKDVTFPNPAFRQLILQHYFSPSHLQDLLLFTLQVLNFQRKEDTFQCKDWMLKFRVRTGHDLVRGRKNSISYQRDS